MISKLGSVWIVVSLICFIALCSQVKADDEFYKSMPKELRCSGCELTVKVLNNMLSHGTANMEKQVDQALANVCETERYSISEYNSERMVAVCEFMIKKHKEELRRELVEHYKQSKKSTYLEFVQHICLDITRMCAGVSHKAHQHHEDPNDTVLHFDRETHDFNVKPGKNVRIPKIVSELHEEL